MNKRMVIPAVVVLLITMLACSFGPLSFNLSNAPLPTVPIAPTLALPPATNNNPPQSQDVLVNIYQQVSPGVVTIQVTTSAGGDLASGFVYDTAGHIITNYHVVQDAQSIEVDFPSGLKVHGKVIGTDLDSDLAIVKVDLPAENLKPLPLGDSDKLQVGQTVVAIGNPFGLSGTMTEGIISAKGRNIESIRQTANGRAFSAGDVIQTDASINPGNSGGPLLNLQGEVVGVNKAILPTGTTSTGEPVNSGIGFAVSINIVKRVVPSLISKGSYDYPYLGISALEELNLTMQEALGLSQSLGAYVMEVVPGGPAAQAGLKAGTKTTKIQGLMAGGDLITAIDGHPIAVYADLIGYLMTQKNPGDQAVLKILRDGKEQEVTITLGKRP